MTIVSEPASPESPPSAAGSNGLLVAQPARTSDAASAMPPARTRRDFRAMNMMFLSGGESVDASWGCVTRSDGARSGGDVRGVPARAQAFGSCLLHADPCRHRSTLHGGQQEIDEQGEHGDEDR